MNLFGKVRNRARALGASLAVLMVMGMASATTYTAQYTLTDLVGQMEADIKGAAQGIFPVLVIAVGLTVGWRFIKRFAGRV